MSSFSGANPLGPHHGMGKENILKYFIGYKLITVAYDETRHVCSLSLGPQQGTGRLMHIYLQ